MKHVKKILSITSALLCAVGLLGTQFPEVNAAENVYGDFMTAIMTEKMILLK